ncbi:MAG TPA: MBL fold metallo-hydrolase [Mycobacteriales bacterium]|nr:MBL fold metallo-hydrolase [Mycobacteriales bacterium]
MKVTVLGCAGTFPSADSGCSAYLVEHDGFRLLLDAGNGAIGALQRHGGIFDLDAVLLSHLHADHCLDLVAYSYARRYHPDRPPLLPVYGPYGTRDRLLQVFDRRPDEGLEDVYAFATTGEGSREIGPFRVDLTPTAHPVECYAIRVTAGGRSVTYSADTGPCAAVADAARETDLFLCESTWLEDSPRPPNLHLTAREAGEHAARAGAGRLALIHTTAYLDQDAYVAQAATAFAGPLERATPGATWDL